MPVWLRRLFGRGELRRGPCYPEMRAAAERVCGDLSLPGERDDAGADMGNWPRLGGPSPTQCQLSGELMAEVRRQFYAARTWSVPGCPADEPHSEEAWRALRR
jgi:hypothetical protein